MKIRDSQMNILNILNLYFKLGPRCRGFPSKNPLLLQSTWRSHSQPKGITFTHCLRCQGMSTPSKLGRSCQGDCGTRFALPTFNHTATAAKKIIWGMDSTGIMLHSSVEGALGGAEGKRNLPPGSREIPDCEIKGWGSIMCKYIPLQMHWTLLNSPPQGI